MNMELIINGAVSLNVLSETRLANHSVIIYYGAWTLRSMYGICRKPERLSCTIFWAHPNLPISGSILTRAYNPCLHQKKEHAIREGELPDIQLISPARCERIWSAWVPGSHQPSGTMGYPERPAGAGAMNMHSSTSGSRRRMA